MRKRFFLSMLVALLALTFSYVTASAEGSKSFTQYGGNRVYTEWDEGLYTAGIERTTKLSVYAKAGEKIYLGSAMTASYDGKDIVLITPSGVENVFDVLPTGKGRIDTYEKEQAGPKIGSKTEGYDPYVYEVKQTGIYTVNFHGYGTMKNNGKTYNPKIVDAKTIVADSQQADATAAWDITVVGTDGAEKTGRVFTSYLALNLGDTKGAFNGRVYVLTKDGYIYNIKMNGMDPYGFIMYSNNRGLVDATSQTSLYKNAISTTNDMLVLKGNVIAPRPDLPDTDKSYTHYIFFNYPAADLPASMPTEPGVMAKIANFNFEGNNGNITTEESGGYFSVEFNKKTTYQLIIDTNKDGVFDEKDTVLADAAAKGVNKIYWNGNDSEGKPVPAGDYDVKIFTKGGEYHFPMLDVETNVGGMSVQLVNDNRVSEEESYMVYYDNSSYRTADKTFVNMNPLSTLGVNPVSAKNGVSSKDGCYKFGSLYGDQKAFDIWTYTLGEEASTSLTVVPGIHSGTISGNVFFDSDRDSTYGANEAGFTSVNVKITADDGTVVETTTDDAGKYTATIPLGKYKVEITNPDGYVLTASTNTFEGTITKTDSNAFIPSVGYFCTKDIGIDVAVSADEVVAGDNLNYRVTVTNTTEFALSSVDASVIIPANTTYLSDTSSGKYDYESGKIQITTMEPGQKVSFVIQVKADADGIYTVKANANCTADTDASNNNASASYNVTAPVIAEDVVAHSKPFRLENSYAYIFGYDDFHMAPENNMKRGESCAVLYRLLKQNNKVGGFNYNKEDAPVYREFAGRWDRSAAEFMIYKGVFADDLPVFRLDGAITRKDAFKMFSIALGFTNDTSLTYEQYATILKSEGYVQGDEDGNLRLDDYITRCEFCKIYNMIIKRDRLDVYDANGTKVSARTYGFTDLDMGEWYYEIMLKATSAYDDEGFVDVSKRGVRNILDDYN